MEEPAPFALVVEDNPLVLMIACDILEEAGFRFFAACDAQAALAVLAENGGQVTLLFTDVEMPGSINGFELAHRVAERWPEIDIIVASGRLTPAVGDIPGKATFISKPFNAQVVHDHLRHILPDDKKPSALRSTSD